MLLLAKSFQLAEISFTETYVHIHTKSSSPAKDCTEKTVWLEKDISRKEYFLRAIAQVGNCPGNHHIETRYDISGLFFVLGT